MNNSPNPKDIIAALKQSGYLMEQQVATQLQALDFHVWTNWAFEDVDEGKSRENSPFYGDRGKGWFISYQCFTKYIKVTSLPSDDVRYFHIHENTLR